MVGAGLLLACQQALAPGERAIPRELPIEEREAARRLPFEGAHNFRDLGGYEAIDNRIVANIQSDDNGESFVHEGPGWYYLELNNVRDYSTVLVQEPN